MPMMEPAAVPDAVFIAEAAPEPAPVAEPSPEPESAAAAPEPVEEHRPEPALRPVVIGKDALPEQERKRGGWRRQRVAPSD